MGNKDIMSIKFNLLLLNNGYLDKHPRSWVCIKGENIKEVIFKIEKGVIKNKNTNREQISKILSKKLSCNFVSIKNILRGKNEFYPLPIILELIRLSKKKNSYKKILENSIEYLKVNSASSNPLKAPKMLSKNLDKILGAFCADGSLSMQFVISSKNKKILERFKLEFIKNPIIKKSDVRNEYYMTLQMNRNNYENIINFSKENKKFQTQTHYNMDLTDEHKSNVETFNKWIYEEFGINPTTFYNKENAWRTIFSNKILARYLIKFFDILPGYKTDIIDEPKIIKNSTLKIRKEFAKGVLMFDGCVTKNKKIMFSSLSPHLAESIRDILVKDNLKVGNFTSNRGEHTIYTFMNNKSNKILEYFEKGTKKWELLMWLNNQNFKSEQITYEKDLYKTNNILELLKKVKICDAEFLMRELNYSHTSIRQHLLILKNKNIIKLSNKPKKINEYISKKTTVFLKKQFHDYLFGRILQQFYSYEKFAIFLEMNKGTISAWKVRKNRIPLYVIKNMCKILNIHFEEVLENIDETDREIAEII